MSSTNQPVIHSLLTVVFVLLLGMVVMLGVAYQRQQHLEDQGTDLQRNFSRQEIQIKNLQGRLEDCDTVRNTTPVDTSWRTLSTPGPVRVLSQITRLPR